MKRLHIYLFLVVLLAAMLQLSARAQFAGGTGRGEVTVTITAVDMNAVNTISSAMYRGGSGKGDNTAALINNNLFSIWENTLNNQVVSFQALANAVGVGVFINTVLVPSNLKAIKRLDIGTYGLTPVQNGLFAAALSKPNNQQLIKGDFRSILINSTNGQTACTVQGSYNQLLWLDNDRLIANTTKCYTDKTLTTLFTGGNGSAWYNIEGGGAVKINSSGLIVEISCY